MMVFFLLLKYHSKHMVVLRNIYYTRTEKLPIMGTSIVNSDIRFEALCHWTLATDSNMQGN